MIQRRNRTSPFGGARFRRSGALAAFWLAAAAVAGAAPVDLPVAATAADSRARLAAAPDQTVYVADLAKKDEGVVLDARPPAGLAPGRYRFRARAALTPIGQASIAGIDVTLRAGAAEQILSVMHFPNAGEPVDLTLDFTVSADNPQPALTVSYAFAGKEAKAARIQGMGKPKLDSGGLGLDGLDDFVGKLDDSGVRSHKQALLVEKRLCVWNPHLEALHALSAETVATDKITYYPGETVAVSVTLRNDTATPVTSPFHVDLVTGASERTRLHAGDAAAPAFGTFTWRGTLPADAIRWGAAIEAVADGGARTAADGRAVFAVRSNFWETALMAACSAGTTLSPDPAQAARKISEWRDQGFTGFEAFFWAPCDMLDFTPDTSPFFGGQGGYPGTIAGASNLLHTARANGLAGTVYANLWGGSGVPAFEVMRRHPEWFGNGNYQTFILENWDLLGPAQDMSLAPHARVGAPGVDWCFNQITVSPPAELFDYHADELIATHRQIGWDGVRYDSYYSRQWSVQAIEQIRRRVNAAVPTFGFGYNSFAMHDHRALSLDAMIGGGGMIMCEGIRIERSRNFTKLLDELNAWRDLVWAYGGHLGPLYRDFFDDVKFTARDIVYCNAIYLATGSHTYYTPLDRKHGDHMAFALRFSEFLFDTRLDPLRDPEAAIAIADAGRFLRWRELARTRSLGNGRQRLVLHLLNLTDNARPFSDLAQATPAPARDVGVTLSLPPGARDVTASCLTPVPRLTATAVPAAAAADGRFTLTVPEVRFGTVVVVDYAADAPLAARPSPKALSDSYIQNWHVLGPFPGDLEFSGFDEPFIPEGTPADLKARFDGRDGQPVSWRRTLPEGAPALGWRPLDFRAALGLDDGKPGTAYAATAVTVPGETAAVLRVRADDNVKLWLNGEPIFSRKESKEIGDQEEAKVAVTLRPGHNEIQAKVCEKWLYWLLALRLERPDGTPLVGPEIGYGL